MASLNITSIVDMIYFSQAWRDAKRHMPHAAVDLGYSHISIDTSQEARELAAAFIMAAAALSRLERDPELDEIKPAELAAAAEAIAEAVRFAAASAAATTQTTASPGALAEARRLAGLTDQELIAEAIDAGQV